MTIKSLHEGTYIIDASKKFTPTPISDTNPINKGIKLSIKPFLINNHDDLLLIDTGMGFKTKQGYLQIHENIRHSGFDPMQVSKVLLTHLHIDHISGTFFLNSNNMLEPSFKNAKYYLQEKELDKMLNANIKPEHREKLEALKNYKNTVFLNGNGQINEKIKYLVTGGHTEFHQIFIIHNDTDTIICGGDVIPMPEQLNVKFIAKYDFDGRKSLNERLYYANYLAKINGICLFYHSTSISIGRISKNNNTFNIINIET